MYEFFITIQWLGIIVLIGEIIYIARKKPSQVQSLLLMMNFFILVNYVGYYFELKAKTMDQAIDAVKVNYIGKPFIALTFFFAVMTLCKVNLPRWLRDVLIAIHLSISFLVFTCKSNRLFYTSIEWREDGFFPHLVLGHSIIYKAYSAMLVGYFIIIVIVVAKKYRHSTNDSEKKQVYFLTSMVAITIGGLLWFLTGTTGGYDVTLPAYLISVMILSYVMLRYQLLDTVAFAKDDALEYYRDGFIVVDNENKIIYSNLGAKNIHDILRYEKQHVEIADLLEKAKKNEYMYTREHVYEIYNREIQRKNITYGKLITIHDVTDKYFYARRLSEEVHKKTQQVTTIQHSVLTNMASMIEARDGITGLHIKNTSNYVRMLVQAVMNSGEYKDMLTEEQAEAIIDASPLHDIGKIAIPDDVLKKPGKLTKGEFDIIKQHPVQGAKMIDEVLADVEEDLYLEIARRMAYYHHEKWDGTGYPCGLKGWEIPLCARIMAIADVYDALLSKRSYKEAFSKEKAIGIMKESSGTHFDPVLIQLFLQCIANEKVE